MAMTAPARERFDRRDLVLGLLAFASSATDVIAFVKLQQVFTSAMTGNTALLGLAIGQGHLFAAIHSLIALCGYIAGVALGATIHTRSVRKDLLVLLGVEAMFMGLFLAQWRLVGFPAAGIGLCTLIASSAISMGVQSVAARKVNLDGIPTVVFTSTLTSIVMTLMHASLGRGAISIFTAKRQLLAFGIYACGATMTALLLWQAIPLAISAPLLAVMGALAIQMMPLREKPPVAP
ncbi:MAG: YoaK family protein [Thiomonas sp.]